jgi:hypothetical protein
MFGAVAMEEKLPGSRSEADSPARGPRRSFGRALVWAVPGAVILWTLVFFLI